jgi:PKD repeat protein
MMTQNILKQNTKKFSVSVLAILLILTALSTVLIFTIPVGACTYTVGTYESDYTTPKTSFFKGETVYGRGTADVNRLLKLRIRDPDGNIVYYSNESKYVVDGSFFLNDTAQTGMWTIQLGVYNCGWHWSTASGRIAYFMVTPADFTLTIQVNGSGSVLKDPNQVTYSFGAIVNLTAVPDLGWNFSHWSGDLDSIDNPESIVMDSNKTVTANFAQNQYTVHVTVVGNGSVSKDPDQPSYTYGSLVNLTALPDLGWHFDHWEGDLSGADNPASILVDANKEITAVFSEEMYTLTVTVDPVGSGFVDIDVAGPYHHGDIVNLTAIPFAGNTFDQWSGDLSGIMNPATLVMDSDKTVTAHFNQEHYTITVHIVGNGSVLKDPDQTNYTFGAMVNLTADPDVGWNFSHWSGDLNSTDNPESIVINNSKIVVAHFIQNQYSLIINVEGSGSVTKDPDHQNYTYGTIVEVTAIPSSGWIFDHWSGDVNGTTNPELVNMTSDKVITAHFKQKESGRRPPAYSSGDDKNLPPIADLSAGEPYQGFINSEITFNGSLSYDPDGYITMWHWDFGDETNGTGETTIHSYATAGTYTANLTVTDNDGATNTSQTTVVISIPNRPPSPPEIDGPTQCFIHTRYSYTAVSTDEDNDTIKYLVDWGDGTTDESEFLPSGIPFSINHTWYAEGNYTVVVTATDGQTSSSSELLVVIEKKPVPPSVYNLAVIILAIIALILYITFSIDILRKKGIE